MRSSLLYVAFYAWLLVAGHGMPYVTDGNESFSIFWHAYNLFHFDIGQSLGITDEAYGPHAAAHPYLYTHQGNFPRLFAFLIYVFGARTIESQVVATTAIVGTATLVLAYRYFARIAEPAFAAIYCALLMTDYVLYAQWHVVHGPRVVRLLRLRASDLHARSWEASGRAGRRLFSFSSGSGFSMASWPSRSCCRPQRSSTPSPSIAGALRSRSARFPASPPVARSRWRSFSCN